MIAEQILNELIQIRESPVTPFDLKRIHLILGYTTVAPAGEDGVPESVIPSTQLNLGAAGNPPLSAQEITDMLDVLPESGQERDAAIARLFRVLGDEMLREKYLRYVKAHPKLYGHVSEDTFSKLFYASQEFAS